MKVPTPARLVFAIALLWPIAGQAQESASEPLARQLAAALDAAKIDSIAAPDPANPGVYIGALYISGGQLLAVAAKYPAPEALDYKLANKAYRDVYLDLAAGASSTRIFVEDMGANGLSAKRRGSEPFDSIEVNGKRVALDSQPRRQKLTADDYEKTFTAADERYCQILTTLIAQLKNTAP